MAVPYSALAASYGVSRNDALIGKLYHDLRYSRVRGLAAAFKIMGLVYAKVNKKYRHAGSIDRLYFHHRFGVPVGKYTYGYDQLIPAASRIAEIGAFCSLAANITFTGINHPLTFITTHPLLFYSSRGFVPADRPELLDPARNKKVVIQNDVWIGANVTILPSVTIHSGAIIGAGAVVNKDVPPYAIVAGNPARIVKYRFPDDVIARLLEIQWWNWPDARIKEQLPLFMNPTQFVDSFPVERQ